MVNLALASGRRDRLLRWGGGFGSKVETWQWGGMVNKWLGGGKRWAGRLHWLCGGNDMGG